MRLSLGLSIGGGGQGGGGGAWTPASLSNLVAIFDPLVGTSTIVDGAAVASWADSSGIGSGKDTTQATAGSRPLYDLVWIDGQPAVDIASGASRSLANTTSNLVAAGSIYTVLSVGEIETGAGTDGGAIFTLRTGTPYASTQHFVSGGVHYVYGDGATVNANLTTPILATIRDPFQSVHAYGGTGVKPTCRVNRTARPVAAGNQASEAAGATGFVIGSNAFNQNFYGKIGYLAIVAGALSAPELASWDAWVTSRFPSIPTS